MSIGKLNVAVELVEAISAKDKSGFVCYGDKMLAKFKACFEIVRMNEKWAAYKQIFEADAKFKFRVIPGIKVSNDMLLICEHGRFEITSVETIKNMYIEVLAKEVK